MKRWLDGIGAALGAWLCVSPWALGFAGLTDRAAWVAWVLGAAILVLGGAAAYRPSLREEAATLALGLFALISPWIVSFAGQSPATWNAVVVGALVAALAVWSMLLEATIRGWVRERLGTH